MSHNVSRARQDEIERRRLLAELQPFLVPGWRIDRGRLQIVPLVTVLGYLQRRQEMLLRCRSTDCHRRVELDFKAAVQAGLGDRTVAHLIERLKCGHWNGCRLEEASSTYPKGVPLVSYVGRQVLVSIRCVTCENRLLLPPGDTISRLQAAKRGDGSTGIIELARVIRGPCRKCGMSRFETSAISTRQAGS